MSIFLFSCDSGGGGGGGGNNASPNKSSITIKIGSDESSDIAADLTETQTDGFYYIVYFTGPKNSEKKGGSKEDPINFEDVPFGDYTFFLEIYYDSTKTLQVGETIKKPNVSIKSESNTVDFTLRRSDYSNYYFVSEAAQLVNILQGKNFAGSQIDTSKMSVNDESTWAKVYLMNDITLPALPSDSTDTVSPAAFYQLNYDNPVCLTIDMKGKTLSSTTPIQFVKNAHFIMKNGNITFGASTGLMLGGGEDTLNPPTLEFDKVKCSGFVRLMGGTFAITNESEINGSGAIAAVTIQNNGTAIMNGGSKVLSDSSTSSTSSSLLRVGVRCSNGGKFIMLGGEVDKIEAISQDFSPIVAMADTDYNAGHKTYNATGANRVTNSFTFNTNPQTGLDTYLPAYLLIGGNSNIKKLQVNNCSATTMPPLKAAFNIVQISDINTATDFVSEIPQYSESSSGGVFAIHGLTGQINIYCKGVLPEGVDLPFSSVVTVDPDSNNLGTLFKLPETDPDSDTSFGWSDNYGGNLEEPRSYYESYYFGGA